MEWAVAVPVSFPAESTVGHIVAVVVLKRETCEFRPTTLLYIAQVTYKNATSLARK
jgi:hypothetical protein